MKQQKRSCTGSLADWQHLPDAYNVTIVESNSQAEGHEYLKKGVSSLIWDQAGIDVLIYLNDI
jgi:hypothetical protein